MVARVHYSLTLPLPNSAYDRGFMLELSRWDDDDAVCVCVCGRPSHEHILICDIFKITYIHLLFIY